MNTLEMWMDYADGLSGDCRVLLFGYPQKLRTNQTLVTGMHAFFQTLGIKNPIFVGASDGGMVAQIYVQKYPGETGGLILISTGGMDANTLKSLKRKYFFAPLMLWYMKHCNYEKLKPTLIKAGMSHIREGDRLCAGYVRDDLPGLPAGKGRAYLRSARRSYEPEARDGGRLYPHYPGVSFPVKKEPSIRKNGYGVLFFLREPSL